MKLVLVVLLSSLSLMAAITEVTVSIFPQKFFIEKIAKDKIKVNVMVKKGFSPATYEPKTSQMKRLHFSDVYFAIGVPFEKVWLERFKSANSTMMVVDTAKGINKIEMLEHKHHHEGEGHDDHDEHKEEKHHDHDEHAHHDHHDEHKEDKHHDHDEHKEEKHHDHDEHAHHDKHEESEHDDHHHDGLDPHIWLDPVLVKVQAKTILDTLVKLDSKNEAYYTYNYKAFIKELDALHHELEEQLHDVEESAFMVFHPSWGYFAKRYHLEQIAVEKEGKEPKPKELTKLIEEAKLHNIKVVFVAPQFSQKAAKVIAGSINGNVVSLDPLSYDYMNNLRKVANSIQQSYK